ncbi:hypothetical protein SPURM210S_03908 [Streptomyces purpurascens]
MSRLPTSDESVRRPSSTARTGLPIRGGSSNGSITALDSSVSS